ncbi:MAG TPA: DNA-formamidopyrimidine glycosylase family protein [Gemmatimonadales bacterium]|jgi:formamidopyrimidine-DNA glycosylase|nr:DNA-formamidopyrimidine glycosylase family protein [Gemmatimonadales bacterium]
MPELPDITVYVERLTAFIGGEQLEALDIHNPFVVRSVEPAINTIVGRRVTRVAHMGKRIVIGFEPDLFLVIHLMIAGRLKWRVPPKRIAGRNVLATFTFARGVLYFTEAGTTRRASLHLVRGSKALAGFDRGGLDVMTITPAAFETRLRSENHTLKRALTDPRLFAGIGNAYSDEILHHARLSPLALTSRLTPDEVVRLLNAIQTVLAEWTVRLREQVGSGFPETVTAFPEGMAVHGRFKLPCPDCGTPVQRIRYATNETNYCARCQTGGRLLADRAMSRLLKTDWPRSIDEAD